jgi:hypothetical protein
MSEDISPPTPQRFIVIAPDGKIEIVGKWKIGELLGAAQALANLANNIEVETRQPPTAIA